MENILYPLLLFVIGILAAIINVNAGGGSSFTLPVLIFMGLDSVTANGTNRIAILMQNITSVYAFKQERFDQFKLSWKLSLLTLPGAVIGAFTALKMDDELFQKVLGVIMILIVLTIIFPSKKLLVTNDSENKKLSLPVILSFIAIGFYGGIIQVGIGFLLMGVLNKIMKFSLIYVNMHKVFVVFILTIPALLIFIVSGKINWYYGLSLGVGNAIGGWWATKISIIKGEKFIKDVLAIAILLMALKLFGIF